MCDSRPYAILFTVGFCCSFGSKHVTPRSLSADLLGCLVCVEGIITKSKSSCLYYTPVYSPSCVAHRFSGEAKGGEKCPLLSRHGEDNGEEIH